MHSNVLPSRSAGVSGRALAVLAALAAVTATLVVGFVVAPPVLAAAWSGRGFADQGDLVAAVREAFVDYWHAGDSRLTPDLVSLADYWMRYHVVKAVLAALVLAALVAFGVLLGRRYVTSGDLGVGRRVGFAAAGVLGAMLAAVASAAVMANIQGAVAPFSSLLSMLPVGEPGGELTDTLTQIEQRLADGDRTPPALDAMIRDFAEYHAAMAVVAACAAAVLLGVSVLSWRRARAAARRARRPLRWVGALSTVSVVALIVVAVANAGTAADPVPALATFFGGGLL
ncbi:hypothetical protein [Prescottella agglutinans]|uniref:hypothetical protein n=1 Tax=Prescottella agglutinans TaxID=1644129 RepID=UPI003D97F41F